MSSFTDLDPIIKQWSSDRQQHLLTRYRDEDVRSWSVVGRSGERCQMWVEVGAGDSVVVRVWDYGDRRQDFPASAATLEAALDEGLSTAKGWVSR